MSCCYENYFSKKFCVTNLNLFYKLLLYLKMMKAGCIKNLIISSIFFMTAISKVPEEQRREEQIKFVNAVTGERDTALHIAAQGGYIETVKTLISIGAKVNMRTDINQTPLHLAAISGQLEVVRYLLMNNAKIGIRDDDKMTALHK